MDEVEAFLQEVRASHCLRPTLPAALVRISFWGHVKLENEQDANKPMVTKAGRRLDEGVFQSLLDMQAFYHWIIHACQTKLNKPEAQLLAVLQSQLHVG